VIFTSIITKENKDFIFSLGIKIWHLEDLEMGICLEAISVPWEILEVERFQISEKILEVEKKELLEKIRIQKKEKKSDFDLKDEKKNQAIPFQRISKGTKTKEEEMDNEEDDSLEDLNEIFQKLFLEKCQKDSQEDKILDEISQEEYLEVSFDDEENEEDEEWEMEVIIS
jgi:hypothetical protein